MPFRSNETVAVFLGVARVQTLFRRGGVININVGIAGDESARLSRGLLNVHPDLTRQLAREGHQSEVADAQRGKFNVERLYHRLVIIGEVHIKEVEVGIEAGDLLHDGEITEVGFYG